MLCCVRGLEMCTVDEKHETNVCVDEKQARTEVEVCAVAVTFACRGGNHVVVPVLATLSSQQPINHERTRRVPICLVPRRARARGFYVPGAPISRPPRYSDSYADINRVPPAHIRVDTMRRAICHACSAEIISPAANGYCARCECFSDIRRGRLTAGFIALQTAQGTYVPGGQTSYANPSSMADQAARGICGFCRRMFCM